jgi:hypothetical protein
MRISIGIDPSVAHTGVCRLVDGKEHVIEEFTTLPGHRPGRLITARERLRAFLQAAPPDDVKDWVVVAMEGEAWMPQGMIDTAAIQATYQVLLWEMRQQWKKAAWPNLLFLPVNIQWVKKWVDAKEKQQVLMKVLKQYGREFTNDNMADAFVLAQIADVYSRVRGGETPKLPARQHEVVKKLVCPWEVELLAKVRKKKIK